MLNRLVVSTPNFTPIYFQIGVNLIVGNKDNENETYNSVGKTLLLRLIDYLLGSKESLFSQFNELKTANVIGSFSFDCGELEISRPLINPNLKLEIVDSSIPYFEKGKSIKIDTWRKWLEDYYWQDIKNATFRALSNILNKFSSIENIDEAIKSFRIDNGTQTGIRVAYLLNLSASKVIGDNDFTFSTKEKTVLDKISKNIGKSLVQTPKETIEKLDTLTLECDKAFQTLNDRIISSEKNKRILRVLKSRLEELKSLEPTSFNKKFSIYQKELGDYLKKNYEEAFVFHSSLVEENKSQIRKRIEVLEKELNYSLEEIRQLETKVHSLSEELSNYADFSLKDSTIESYMLNRFLSRQDISKVVTRTEKALGEKHYAEVLSLLDADAGKIDSYRNFLNKIYKCLFGESEGRVAFNVSYSKQNVFKITLHLPNDSGEGIGSLKSLIFLFLLVFVNARERKLDYMLIDSACVDSIDKDVFSRFLKIADEIAKKARFQFICAINDQNANIQELAEIYKARILTPQNNLFGMQLTSEPANLQS